MSETARGETARGETARGETAQGDAGALATPAARRRRVGVIGSMVWDVIHGRDKRAVPVEEWGGISYSLAGLDAALDDDWEIVPLIKVGDDLVDKARAYCRSHG